MSYYRYITGVYKSYWPQLNRTLRSSSVPRSVPDLDSGRFARASSVPPTSYYSNSFLQSNNAMPFRERAQSVPRAMSYSSSSSYSTGGSSWRASSSTSTKLASSYNYSHYSDYDDKVIDYNSKLRQDDAVRSYVSSYRTSAANDYYRDGDYRTGFSKNYNYYDAGKHSSDYLYKSTGDVLGSWKHFNLSNQTITERNNRAKSPLVTRELDRYYETRKRSDYIGDVSSGAAKDFRFYNYRRVPYFGGSDGYQYMKQKPRRK